MNALTLLILLLAVFMLLVARKFTIDNSLFNYRA